MENLQLIKKLTFEEVFEYWRRNEAHQEGWNRLAKERGYASWEEWRMSYAKRFRCQEPEWSLYEIADPTKTVSQFWGGPFSGWVKNYYGGQISKSFAELAQSDYLRENPKVKDMLENFPKDTIMTGIRVAKKIYIIEGMHRAVALSIMNYKRMKFSGKVFIALADSSEELGYEPRMIKKELE